MAPLLDRTAHLLNRFLRLPDRYYLSVMAVGAVATLIAMARFGYPNVTPTEGRMLGALCLSWSVPLAIYLGFRLRLEWRDHVQGWHGICRYEPQARHYLRDALRNIYANTEKWDPEDRDDLIREAWRNAKREVKVSRSRAITEGATAPPVAAGVAASPQAAPGRIAPDRGSAPAATAPPAAAAGSPGQDLGRIADPPPVRTAGDRSKSGLKGEDRNPLKVRPKPGRGKWE